MPTFRAPKPSQAQPKTKPLILYPAIDLKGGRCVRLSQGDFDKATIYEVDPADQAKLFVGLEGFSWIHVVDLDGSVEGKAVNGEAVSAILKTVPVPVQLGGGVRNMAAVERWLEAGVSRGDPRHRRRARSGLRHRGRRAALSRADRRGPGCPRRPGGGSGLASRTAGLSALEVGRRFEDAGVAALVVTDISRDGMLTGVDAEVFGQVADAVSISVIAAGGMTTVADIDALRGPQGRPHRRRGAGQVPLRRDHQGPMRPWPPRGPPAKVLKVRVIPCLDVKDGRVVKGVQFQAVARRRRSGGAGRGL